MSHLIAVVTCRAKPGEADAAAASFLAMVAPSNAEPGCLRYDVHRGVDDPDVFVLYEEYVDRAGFEAHQASEHFARHVVNGAWPHLAERQRTLCTLLAPS